MSKPQRINDLDYWKKRIEEANRRKEIHRSVFECIQPTWEIIEEGQRQKLLATIKDDDSILDAGCGYGRLLDLLPDTWKGRYYGIDISPDFIALAREIHPHYEKNFRVADIRNLRCFSDQSFDWAIMISIKPMIVRNLGGDEWEKMERELSRVAKNLLYLEMEHGEQDD